ncbi:hypothetical protein GENT5_13980 [Flavobacterium ammoniigenes]|uniref:DUF932 domain-containing protein n=1 Tax=Flavobacterium ammoniigenes TaxID=1751095 RepID=A0ABN6L0C9_9FLAO|nr:hypothetical protein [Flavobacterium ammoniigenes]BDB55093.1 hypothetical protein GENT5_13980 [Flavobacterium ammoniigenes]
MKFIQDTQSFEVLKPYFIPAIYHRILEGRKKIYQLSISMDGVEKVIKKSAKPFEHASFNKVITGAVKRMEKLFAPDHLDLEVILYKKPSLNQLGLSFELVNKNLFKIGNEDYFASIMCEYSYSKMNVVTYYPIIYRQVCSNGMVSVMSKNFTETISSDKIFDIGCEWSKCTFETYQRKLKDYFEILQYGDDKLFDETTGSFESKAIRKMERVLKISIMPQNIEVLREFDNNHNAESILSDNIETLGYNEFAVWNAITDFASRERDVTKRNQMFLNAGKFLSNEVEKTLNKRDKEWSENLVWNQILRIAKK